MRGIRSETLLRCNWPGDPVIFELKAEEDKKARQEKLQVPSCSEDNPLPTDETIPHEADLSCKKMIKRMRTSETAGEQEHTDVGGIREHHHVDAKKNVKDKKVFRRSVRGKPRMTDSADISDYLTFKCDEKSWTDHRTKQASLQAAHTGNHYKTIGRAGHRKDGEKDPGHAPSHTRSSRTHAVVVVGGRLSVCKDKKKAEKMSGEKSPYESFYPYKVGDNFEVISNKRVYRRPRPPPPYTAATVRSLSEHLGVLSSSRGPSSSAVTSLVQKTASCSDGLINTSKTIKQQRENEDREFRKCGFDQVNHPTGDRNRKKHNKRKKKGSSAHTRSPSKHLGVPSTSRGPSSSVQMTVACSAGLINNSKIHNQQRENEDCKFRKCGFDQDSHPIGERNRKKHNKKKKISFSAHTRDEQQRHRDTAKQGRTRHDLHRDNEAGDQGVKGRQGNQEEVQHKSEKSSHSRRKRKGGLRDVKNPKKS